MIESPLRGKHILITAGPTWVPIDNVRVISNTSTGETGILLAQELRAQGARVTLVLGPVADKGIRAHVKIIRFRFYDELKNILIKEIRSKKYDVVIQSAAVSDYRPSEIHDKKIKSGINNLKLFLKPTDKIIDRVKKLDPDVFLVGFKFEPGTTKNTLIDRAQSFIRRSKADLAVANTVVKGNYKAYVLGGEKISGPFLTKEALVRNLAKEIGENLCKN
jgi:phosphopantothenoylcysteine decarboxylase/phosphopantothenate--cysteine ligase